MNFRKIFFSVIIFSTSLTLAQNNTNTIALNDSVASSADTISVQQLPEVVEQSLDSLLQSWMLRRIDSLETETAESNIEVNDSIYKDRLKRMPCLMEMPYNKVIRSYIELYTVRKRTQLELMMGLSDYYFPIFEQKLAANDLPLELKYLPIIESALNTTIVSKMGAAGLWQFMIATGKIYGLEINSLIDERLDPIKATDAAIKFLKDLHSIYGDWNLVIAAYNCGPGNVNKAIRRAGRKRDYWAIYPYLPKETRGYVPIFIAANYAMNYGHKHNITKKTAEMPVIVDTIMVSERFHLKQISTVLGMDIKKVRLLNPQYRKDIVPGDIKPYSICLPLNKATAFIDNYKEVITYKDDSLVHNRRKEIEIARRSSVSWRGSGKVKYHRVRGGQTLSHIALKYRVSVRSLKKWNGLRTSRIRAGQRLKIYK